MNETTLNLQALRGDGPREEIEITGTTVALLKLPFPVGELVAIMKALEKQHGRNLRMMEQPKGWLNFFEPAIAEPADKSVRSPLREALEGTR